MQLPPNSKILAESQLYALYHEFEDGYLFDKRKDSSIYLGNSYGDPQFGIIDSNEQWALLLGNSSYLWTPAEIFHVNKAIYYNSTIFQWPHTARQINDFEVEILDDPWADNPGVYSFDIKTKVIERVRDFKQLDVPYTDQLEINW